METLSVKHNTKSELLTALGKLVEKLPEDSFSEDYEVNMKKSTKQEIFDEIDRLESYLSKHPVEDFSEVKEPVVEEDPLVKMEDSIRIALGYLIKSGNELNEFIDEKDGAERNDRFVHEAIAGVENAIHRLHVREGRKAKEELKVKG